MQNILFITIGTRDIKVDKNWLIEKFGEENVAPLYSINSNSGKEFPLPRKLGAFLLEQGARFFKEHGGKIELPIIAPCIQFLERKIPAPEQVDEVWLVSTDQPEGEDLRYWLNDTCYYADIIEKLLSTHRHSKTKQSFFSKIKHIKVTENVAYLDTMFDKFNKDLSNRKFQHLENAPRIWLLNQGGIDAINYGLMLNMLYRYGSKTTLLGVNEKTKNCTVLNFTNQFTLEQEKRRLVQAVERYDYAAIKSMDLPEPIKMLAAYAEARLNFDFEAALDRLQQMTDLDFRAIQETEMLDLEKASENDASLTRELFWNAKIKFSQEAYVDFVQRFFRIVEQLAMETATSFLDFSYDHNTWTNDFGVFINKPENQDLKGHLDNTKIHGKKLDYLSMASVPVFNAILEFYEPGTHAFIKRIDPLRTLRNKGIGAHGWNPISRQHILDALECNEQELEELMEEVAERLKVGDDPFERINQYFGSRL